MFNLFFHHKERDQRNGEEHGMTLNELCLHQQIINIVTAVAKSL